MATTHGLLHSDRNVRMDTTPALQAKPAAMCVHKVPTACQSTPATPRSMHRPVQMATTVLKVRGENLACIVRLAVISELGLICFTHEFNNANCRELTFCDRIIDKEMFILFKYVCV